jgi:hypothetical protein
MGMYMIADTNTGCRMSYGITVLDDVFVFFYFFYRKFMACRYNIPDGDFFVGSKLNSLTQRTQSVAQMAQVAAGRLDEMQDPELTMEHYLRWAIPGTG